MAALIPRQPARTKIIGGAQVAEDAIRVWPGLPYPLGATWDGSGTNFALFSAHAEEVELCLFDDASARSPGYGPS